MKQSDWPIYGRRKQWLYVYEAACEAEKIRKQWESQFIPLQYRVSLIHLFIFNNTQAKIQLRIEGKEWDFQRLIFFFLPESLLLLHIVKY